MRTSSSAFGGVLGTGLVIALVGLGLGTPHAAAQMSAANEEELDLLAAPADAWTVRRDQGSRGDAPRTTADAESFSVRTGASTILYRPDVTAGGSYTLDLTFSQFDPGGRNEGYGIVLGGVALDGAEQAYTYLLIRQDGFALLKRRDGARTPIVRDWFEVPSLRTWAGREAGADYITNTVNFDVQDGRIAVRFNGVEALEAELPSSATSGLLGLRVNHGLSIRVDQFNLTKP